MFLTFLGNHRRQLLDHGITSWPTRVISNDEQFTQSDLNRIADWLNDAHDSGSIHFSYWKRMESVKKYMISKFKKGEQTCSTSFNHFRKWLFLVKN